jgi:hypothetical protein
VGGFQLSCLEKKQNRTLRFVNKSLKMHLKNGIKLNGTSFWFLSSLYIVLKNWMHSFEVSLGYESVDRSTFPLKRSSASCWKCSSINAFIPQWNFKRMHSILIIIFKSHQNLIQVNFSLWILFVLDYLLLEITTPLIVYIWPRHGGTCKFGFEFHWDVKRLFYNHVTTS